MRPKGQRSVKFPGKTDVHPRKGNVNWWEVIDVPRKSRDRQKYRREIERDAEEWGRSRDGTD